MQFNIKLSLNFFKAFAWQISLGAVHVPCSIFLGEGIQNFLTERPISKVWCYAYFLQTTLIWPLYMNNYYIQYSQNSLTSSLTLIKIQRKVFNFNIIIFFYWFLSFLLEHVDNTHVLVCNRLVGMGMLLFLNRFWSLTLRISRLKSGNTFDNI